MAREKYKGSVGRLDEILGCVGNRIKIGVLLAGAVVAGNNISIANTFNEGSLEIINIVNDPNFIISSHFTKHLRFGTEGYDAYDLGYFSYLPHKHRK